MSGASTMFTSLIAWFEASMFIKVWTSLTDWCSKTRKCIPVWEDEECDKYAIND